MHPPTLTIQANFTLMTECTPKSRRYYFVYSVGQPNGAITGDDLSGPGRFRLTTSRNRPGPGKSSPAICWRRKMTYRGLADSVSRNRPGPGKSSSGIRWRRKVILPNLQRGFDVASCLKSSSGDTRFRLVVSRNWPDSGKSSYGDWKIAEIDFGWTKSS